MTGVVEADERPGSGRTGLDIEAGVPEVLCTGVATLGEAVAGYSFREDLSLWRGRSPSALRFSGATNAEVVDGFGWSPLICARRSPICTRSVAIEVVVVRTF